MPTRLQARSAIEAGRLADKVKTAIDIKLKKQIHAFACYSAVTEAVLKHYGIEQSQRKICDSYPKNKNGKDAMQDPITALKQHGIFERLERNAPQFHIIQAEIDKNRPIICKVEQHYILLVGYDSHNNVYLKDPIKGNDLIEMPYDVFESRGFLTKYPTKEQPDGVEAHYLVAGYYLTKPPGARRGGGRGTRRANRMKVKGIMRKGTRHGTRHRLRGGWRGIE
jgi:hypothetical protein